MDTSLSNLKQSLLQHLLRNAQGHSAENVTAAKQAARLSALTAMPGTARSEDAGANQTRITLPPTLRQLFAQHQQVHNLLPTIHNSTVASTTSGDSAAMRLVQVFASQLATNPQSLTPEAIKTLVSQWFSTNPAQALSSAPVASSASWLQSLSPMLLLTLLQRLPDGPVRQLLSQLFGQQPTSANSAQAGATPAQSPLANLLSNGGLSNQLQGSLNDIRLSQVLLADSSANQQPDYYLVLPYQLQQHPRHLELLLRKRSRQHDQQQQTYWLFSMRFETSSAGPILAKGRYQQQQNDQPAPSAQLRLYTQSEAQRDTVQQHLKRFDSKLKAAGIQHLDSEVHVGRVPETLAPEPHELVKVRG